MPRLGEKLMGRGRSFDEPDFAPLDMEITYFDIVMIYVAIIGHLVDLGIDLNIAIQYNLAGQTAAFWWTLLFILFPALVNTAITIKMYSQDKGQGDSITNRVTGRKFYRIFILLFQLAPILRFIDSLRYGLKSKRAGKNGDVVLQRKYYILMLKEDSDAALLRIFECFLEAAPQQVLQMSLMMIHGDVFRVSQSLSILSSLISMGWCLAAYQRAIRFTQEDKNNMSWTGTILQIIWHFAVTLSRITALSCIIFMYPYWSILAVALHILFMCIWLQVYDRSPFCAQNKFSQLAFSLVMATVYVFTYVLPLEGNTRYRYTLYYTICFLENAACLFAWLYIPSEVVRKEWFYYPALAFILVPFIVGIFFMCIYYKCFHPRVLELKDGNRRQNGDLKVNYSVNDNLSDI